MVIAYLRVSTERQNIENQKREIENFARLKGLKIERWRHETVSGTKDKEQRMLGSILRHMHKDDILIISEISRLSRTMLEIMGILNLCIKKGIALYSIKEGYAFENNMNSKIMGFAFAMAAEIERNLISQRTREALLLKKAEGIVLGRPIGESVQWKNLIQHSDQIQESIRTKVTKTAIAAQYNVSRVTLYKYLKTLPHKISIT